MMWWIVAPFFATIIAVTLGSVLRNRRLADSYRLDGLPDDD